MKKLIVYIFIITITACSCSQQKNNSSPGAKTIDRNWLYSIIKASDSSYTKPYKRTDFVTAVYYINKKDSSVCQVMKDSADSIRQIIITKKDTRIFFGSYYKNGQLQAHLPLDEFGQFHGEGNFYYEDGSLQSKGNYTQGFKTGEWKVYDEKGEITNTDSYDSNGNLMPQKAP